MIRASSLAVHIIRMPVHVLFIFVPSIPISAWRSGTSDRTLCTRTLMDADRSSYSVE